MQIPYNPANFEAIYRTLYPLSHTYQFVYFLPYLKDCGEPPFIDEKGNQYMLEVSSSIIDKRGYGEKSEWVSVAIDFSVFNRTRPFLYKHEGEFGYYILEDGTFNRFTEDITHRVHKFYYDKMSL